MAQDKEIRTFTDRRLAAPGAVLEAQPPGEAVELVVPVALVEGRRPVVSHVRGQRVSTVLYLLGLAAVDVCYRGE